MAWPQVALMQWQAVAKWLAGFEAGTQSVFGLVAVAGLFAGLFAGQVGLAAEGLVLLYSAL